MAGKKISYIYCSQHVFTDNTKYDFIDNITAQVLLIIIK